MYTTRALGSGRLPGEVSAPTGSLTWEAIHAVPTAFGLPGFVLEFLADARRGLRVYKALRGLGQMNRRVLHGKVADRDRSHRQSLGVTLPWAVVAPSVYK